MVIERLNSARMRGATVRWVVDAELDAGDNEEAEEAEADRGQAGPGPEPVDAVAEGQHHHQGDRPQGDPDLHHPGGVHP